MLSSLYRLHAPALLPVRAAPDRQPGRGGGPGGRHLRGGGGGGGPAEVQSARASPSAPCATWRSTDAATRCAGPGRPSVRAVEVAGPSDPEREAAARSDLAETLDDLGRRCPRPPGPRSCFGPKGFPTRRSPRSSASRRGRPRSASTGARVALAARRSTQKEKRHDHHHRPPRRPPRSSLPSTSPAKPAPRPPRWSRPPSPPIRPWLGRSRRCAARFPSEPPPRPPIFEARALGEVRRAIHRSGWLAGGDLLHAPSDDLRGQRREDELLHVPRRPRHRSPLAPRRGGDVGLFARTTRAIR